MDTQLDTAIAPDEFYMYAKNELYCCSQSRDFHVEANSAKHPPEGLKCTMIETIFAVVM